MTEAERKLIGKKIKEAREAKHPSWRRSYLVERLLGRLGRDLKKLNERVKNLELGRIKFFEPGELEAISEVLGTDEVWQTTVDDQPVKWRKEGATKSSIEQLDITKWEPREVPNWGYVPALGWQRPGVNDMKPMPTTYKGQYERIVCVQIRGENHLPRFQPDTRIYIAMTGVPVIGTYNLVLAPDQALHLGFLKVARGRKLMDFRDLNEQDVEVDGWEFIGHAIHAEESNDGGLRP